MGRSHGWDISCQHFRRLCQVIVIVLELLPPDGKNNVSESEEGYLLTVASSRYAGHVTDLAQAAGPWQREPGTGLTGRKVMTTQRRVSRRRPTGRILPPLSDTTN